MKYKILRVHPKGLKAERVEIETDNLNATRKEMCEKYGVESVAFSYETDEPYEGVSFKTML